MVIIGGRVRKRMEMGERELVVQNSSGEGCTSEREMQEESFKDCEAEMLEQEGWRNGDERWNTWLRERKSGHGWSTGVNDDRVNGGGIFSTEADRTSRKPRAGDQGHVGVGREFQEPGTGSRAFSNPVVFM